MRLAAGLLLGTLSLTAAASTSAQAPNVACDIEAVVADPDPNGMNVRAAPTTRSRVLGVIPLDGSGVATIRAQRGDWFRVTRIVDGVSGADLFRGDGWVHGSLLDIDTTGDDPRLYSAPDRRSRILRPLQPDGTPITLIGCSGQWAKVRAAGSIGWLSPNGQCSNPLTNCS